nr:hypothetical protein [Tanacetum cinerariifolium]
MWPDVQKARFVQFSAQQKEMDTLFLFKEVILQELFPFSSERQEVLKLLTDWQPYKHNLIILREIKKVNEKVSAAQVGREQCKGPHYTKDFPLKEEGASVSVMPLSTYLNLGLGELAHTKLRVELADRTVKYPKGIAENVLVVLEDMDAYRDEEMGNVIFGEPFLREVGINTRRFEGMITFTMDQNMSKMRRWKNDSHAGTKACMRWSEESWKEKV